MRPGTPAADVVIVGAGPEGMAIAYAFTRRGVRDVIVCAAGAGGSGPPGSTGDPGPGGGAVHCSATVPALAAMAWAGTHLFEDATDVLGEDVGYRRCGRLVGVTAADLGALDAGIAMRRALGIDVARVAADAVAARWPELAVRDFAAFAHEPRGGYADTRRTARAFARAARHGGAAILPCAPVVSVSATRDRITGVRLSDGREVATGTVVVAAGADSPAFVEPLGVTLPVRAAREFAVRVRVGRAVDERPVLVDLPHRRYLRPDGPGQLLLGALDPAADAFDDELTARAAAHLAARLPGFREIAPVAAFGTRHDAGPDHLPLIGSVGPDGLFVAAGCGEHGLGIVPAVGTLVADLLCDGASGRPDIPGADFHPDRFAARTRSPGTRRPPAARPPDPADESGRGDAFVQGTGPGRRADSEREFAPGRHADSRRGLGPAGGLGSDRRLAFDQELVFDQRFVFDQGPAFEEGFGSDQGLGADRGFSSDQA
ncbi:NAD(P)/FAD-dependent oxidoreductase [Embleya sp. NPDC050154]|uniref:NAD(P)/FAD-dependent oxidoreductase n=1 Tax=Embleya sp. NPDC050154 TaxID=3363988 RepID=UPI00379B2988